MAVGFVCERAHCARQDYERRLGTTALPVRVRTYDAADNMTAKVEPFKDDFSDGNYTGWAPYPTNGWSAANGYMQNTTAAGWSWYSRAQTDPSVDLQLSYRLDSGTNRMYVRPRQVNNANGDRIELLVYPTWMWLRQYLGGVMTDFGTWSNTSTAGSWYDLRVECDGANIKVWKGPKGGTMTLLKQVSTCTVTTTDSLMFITVDSQWSFDDIRVLSDSMSTNTTLAYNSANELTSTTSDANTTSYTYDAYGRMTAKTWGSYSATYAYRYGDKLTAVTSNFPGEGNVTYEYGGNGKRRSRNDGASTTGYRWGDGASVVEEESSGGTLTRSYINDISRATNSVLAGVDGANPPGGAYQYYSDDAIGSTRDLRDQSKNSLSTLEFEPYGGFYTRNGVTVSHAYTGHEWDTTARLYYTLNRYLDPGESRWSSRDPLGYHDGMNKYAYVKGRPINSFDPLGTSSIFGSGQICVDKSCNADKLRDYYYLPEDLDNPTDPETGEKRNATPGDLRHLPAPGTCADADGFYTPNGRWKIPDTGKCTLYCNGKTTQIGRAPSRPTDPAKVGAPKKMTCGGLLKPGNPSKCNTYFPNNPNIIDGIPANNPPPDTQSGL